MHQFTATLKITGINPFVLVPAHILKALFELAGKDKSPIPICGTVNHIPYTQSLVKHKGQWTLYVNTQMLKDSPKRIGEEIEVTIDYDPSERTIIPHPKLLQALKADDSAKAIFDSLNPSLQKEIIRYISFLKSEKSIDQNIIKAIGFLKGENRFIGREKI
jgi:hypothetical protein